MISIQRFWSESASMCNYKFLLERINVLMLSDCCSSACWNHHAPAPIHCTSKQVSVYLFILVFFVMDSKQTVNCLTHNLLQQPRFFPQLLEPQHFGPPILSWCFRPTKAFFFSLTTSLTTTIKNRTKLLWGWWWGWGEVKFLKL